MNAKTAAGFTLLELMIAVVVVALLTSIAYPTYIDQIRKSKRAEGKAALLKTAQLQERWYTSNSVAAAYSDTLAPLYGLAAGTTVRSGEDPTDAKSAYDLSIVTSALSGTANQAYTLTATPRAGVFTDPDCASLSLTSTGQRTFAQGTSGKGSKDLCW